MARSGKRIKMAVNVEVKARNGEPVERLIKRFVKKVKKEGILEEYRDRKYYKKPSEVRRQKKLRRDRIMKDLRREREAQLKD